MPPLTYRKQNYIIGSPSCFHKHWGQRWVIGQLGAVLGDFLDKPISQHGLALSRYTASATLIIFIVFCLLVFPQKTASTQQH